MTTINIGEVFGGSKTRSRWTFHIWTDEKKKKGWVLYHVRIFDHKEKTQSRFTLRYPKVLENKLWLSYEVLREFTFRALKQTTKKYEI